MPQERRKIESIEVEERLCREAWAKAPNAEWAWCCHHENLVEKLLEPANNRIEYIKNNKFSTEQAVRFYNFRPVLGELPKPFTEAQEAREKAREAQEAWEKAQEAQEAREVWEKAWEKAWEKVWEARENCKCLIEAQHKTEYPNSTWNGRTIL